MSINPTHIITDLILDNTSYGEDESVAILSADSVDLIEAIGEVVQNVDVYDLSYRAVERLRGYVRLENVHFFDTVYPPSDTVYDTVIMFVPKGREFARGLMWAAMQRLKTGGVLYIAGATKGGAKTLIKDAKQLFGDCNTLAYKKSHRVAAAIKREDRPYPDDWGDDPSEVQKHRVETAFGEMMVATMPGVFSWQNLDEGTAFLLENIDLMDAQSILDLGCGNGIVGASVAPKAEQVVMVDDNLLAVRCATQTVAINTLNNVTVQGSDVYSTLGDARFDLIINNPPFHKQFDVNTDIARRMIEQAADYLNESGRLLLVANAFLKYEPIFEEHFPIVATVARNNKYKVIEGKLS